MQDAVAVTLPDEVVLDEATRSALDASPDRATAQERVDWVYRTLRIEVQPL